MTSETTVGVTHANTTNGEMDAGGGICTFATTFAVPASVINKVSALLKKKDYPQPKNNARFFAFDNNDPDPVIGIVPILENNVTIEVPALSGVGDSKTPFLHRCTRQGQCNYHAAHADLLDKVRDAIKSYNNSQIPQLRGRPVRLQENFLQGVTYSI
jgi:hypothetical protein